MLITNHSTTLYRLHDSTALVYTQIAQYGLRSAFPVGVEFLTFIYLLRLNSGDGNI